MGGHHVAAHGQVRNECASRAGRRRHLGCHEAVAVGSGGAGGCYHKGRDVAEHTVLASVSLSQTHVSTDHSTKEMLKLTWSSLCINLWTLTSGLHVNDWLIYMALLRALMAHHRSPAGTLIAVRMRRTRRRTTVMRKRVATTWRIHLHLRIDRDVHVRSRGRLVSHHVTTHIRPWWADKLRTCRHLSESNTWSTRTHSIGRDRLRVYCDLVRHLTVVGDELRHSSGRLVHGGL
jgi:hypothetical protein